MQAIAEHSLMCGKVYRKQDKGCNVLMDVMLALICISHAGKQSALHIVRCTSF